MVQTRTRRNTDQPLSGWAAFGKFVGIQGVLALVLVIGYVIASLTNVMLSDTYVNITFAVIGFYFAKNGVGILDVIRSKNNG